MPGAAGGGGGKLGGNPPRIFDGTCSKANTFMNEFNLYHLTNIGVDQVDNPMKRTALLLGFIQGENVKDWVKCWTIWSLNQYNTGLISADELYWNTVSRAFETAFQDTGVTEHTEEKLHHLTFTPGEIDGFIAKFESLANKAGYSLNNRSTITLFTSKLPFQMMNHLYKIVRPHNFVGWANGAHQYHQDNQAVQNIKDIHGESTSQTPQKQMTPKLIGTVRQIETVEPKEGLAPQPQKMLINSTQKAAVSPATNRVTSLGIAWINLRTIKPTKPISRKRKLKPAKQPLLMKLLMKKALIMGTLKSILGSIKARLSRQKIRKPLFIGLGKLKQGCWLVLRQIFNDDKPHWSGRAFSN